MPNSALFLNPALARQDAAKPERQAPSSHLRLIKGSRVDSALIPSAA